MLIFGHDKFHIFVNHNILDKFPRPLDLPKLIYKQIKGLVFHSWVKNKLP